MKGMLLAENGDLKVTPLREEGRIQAGVAVGDSTMQDACIVLELNQGELKEDPLLGPNLLRFIRAKAGRTAIVKQVRMHLERDGLDYDELKEMITINLKTD